MLNEYLKEWKPRIQEVIQANLEGDGIFERAREYPLRGGKYLRPIMVLLGAKDIGGTEEDVLQLATAVELIHNFTLIHDDIEDHSQLRRGKKCLHVEWGTPLAINAGDFLFAKSFFLASKYDKEVFKFLAKTVCEIAEGQDMDIFWAENNIWPSEEDYFKMVEKKTGVLLGASLYLGAFALGEKRPDLYEFGKKLGVIFQLKDDLLNLLNKNTGKDWGTDITEGKRTLIAIKSIHKPEVKKIIESNTKDAKDIEKTIELMDEGIKYTQKRMNELISTLKNPAKNPDVKEMLNELKEFVLKRQK